MCEIEVDENNGYVSIFLSQSSPEVKNLLPTSDVTSTKWLYSPMPPFLYLWDEGNDDCTFSSCRGDD